MGGVRHNVRAVPTMLDSLSFGLAMNFHQRTTFSWHFAVSQSLVPIHVISDSFFSVSSIYCLKYVVTRSMDFMHLQLFHRCKQSYHLHPFCQSVPQVLDPWRPMRSSRCYDQDQSNETFQMFVSFSARIKADSEAEAAKG